MNVDHCQLSWLISSLQVWTQSVIKAKPFIEFILHASRSSVKKRCAVLYSCSSVLVLKYSPSVFTPLRFIPVCVCRVVTAVGSFYQYLGAKRKKKERKKKNGCFTPSFHSCWCVLTSHSWLMFSLFLQVAATNWPPPPIMPPLFKSCPHRRRRKIFKQNKTKKNIIHVSNQQSYSTLQWNYNYSSIY